MKILSETLHPQPQPQKRQESEMWSIRGDTEVMRSRASCAQPTPHPRDTYSASQPFLHHCCSFWVFLQGDPGAIFRLADTAMLPASLGAVVVGIGLESAQLPPFPVPWLGTRHLPSSASASSAARWVLERSQGTAVSVRGLAAQRSSANALPLPEPSRPLLTRKRRHSGPITSSIVTKVPLLTSASLAHTFNLRRPATRTSKNNCMLFGSPRLRYFVMTALAN